MQKLAILFLSVFIFFSAVPTAYADDKESDIWTNQFDPIIDYEHSYLVASSGDRDGDGYDDDHDEFPDDPSEHSDMDHDGEGDNSDDDRDGDGELNDNDPDPNNPNPVADTTPPAITVQQPAITVEATAAQMTASLGVVTATDLVDGAITPTSDAPATFPLGVTTVTYTATDAAGNAATAQQLVTVQDTTPPAITAPAAVTADSATGLPIAVNIGIATATDAFAPVTITNNAPATFPIGNTTVTWTATDANGNTSTATQLVTVNDASIFANLPPDPGAAGKATLEGIDSDADGVRDDVQRWIVMTYPNSQKTRAGLTQRTKTMQLVILDAADPVKSLAHAKELIRDTDCLEYVSPTNYYDNAMGLKAIFLNTYMRSKAWLQADKHLSGTMFKALPYEQRKQGCSFDPDVMPN